MDPNTDTPGDSPAIRAAIVDLIAADQMADAVRPVAAYAQRFPGYEDCVQSVYDSLSQGEELEEPKVQPSIGGLRVIRELGQGGQALVYLAEDLELGRKVAVKILSSIHAVDADRQERFRREAALVARLEDPGISRLYRVGIEDGRPFFVMEYVEGPTLAEVCAEGDARTSHGVDAILTWFEQLARSLHGAHSAGVIHRDIKPANIVLSNAGRPVLLDFGLARSLDEQWTQLTMTGAELGTPAYMSPEQIGSGRVVDTRTDIYSLGVALYEVLAGVRPFRAPSRDELTDQIKRGRYRALKSRIPDLDPSLQAVVAKAMERSPERRFSTALEFAEDLRRCLEQQPVLARRLPLSVRAGRFVIDHPVAASMMVALGLGLGVSVFAMNEARGQRQIAEARLLVNEQMIADLKVQELIDSEDPDLWRVHPDTVDTKVAWLKVANQILSRQDSLKDALRELRLQGSLGESQYSRQRELLALQERLRKESAARSENSEQRAELARRESEAEALIRVETHREFDDPQLQWRHDHLVALVARLESIGEQWPDHMTPAIVEQQLELSRRVHPATVQAHRKDWDAALAALRRDPRYGNLKSEPICGLVPLGRDEASGLWEFAVWATGEIPTRDESGKLAPPQGKHAVVLVLVPGGRFVAGEKSERGVDTRRQVELLPFLAGKHEVTQAQWGRVMGRNPSMYQGREHSPLCPVERVTALQADEFARRIGGSLPSAAQWEYACLAGRPGQFAWDSGAVPAHAVLQGRENVAGQELHIPVPAPATWSDGYDATSPVGAFASNSYGLFDVHGNVTEWTADNRLSSPDQGSSARILDQVHPGDGRLFAVPSPVRTHKGGSYYMGPSYANARRNFFAPVHTANAHLGVRVVMAWPRK